MSTNRLPDEWVQRIFARLEAGFGARMADLWRGTDLRAVMAVWAEALAPYATMPDAIAHALRAVEDGGKAFPPTLPEFKALCAAGARRLDGSAPALTYTPSADDIERNRRRAEAAAISVGHGRAMASPKAWALRIRDKHQANEKLPPAVIEVARDALGEEWTTP